MTDVASLEELYAIFADEQDSELDTKFRAGDALITALANRKAWGFASNTELLATVGATVGLSKRALEYRVQVARTFPPETRDVPVRWDVYRAAARTDAPLLWLHFAADNSLSAEKIRGLYAQVDGSDPNALDIQWPIRNADVALDYIYIARDGGLQVTFTILDPTKVDVGALDAATVGQLSFSTVAETVTNGVAQEAA